MTTPNATGIGFSASSDLGVVGAGSAESVAAGIDILARGGNAADAAVATLFVLVVTDHGPCSIGGEVPLMIYDAATGETHALSGQGRAPLDADAIDWYMAHGIPGEGDIRMAAVPSVVDLCITTLARYGTRTLADVTRTAIALLDVGTEEWHPKLACTLRRMVEEESLTSGTREEKLQAACDRFYGRHAERNDIADDLEADYIAKGGFLRRADLAAHVTTIESPVTIDYRGFTICKCDTWTQGPVLLQALRLLEGFDLRAMGQGSADYIHVVTEAIKLAMADRDEYYADPEFADVPLDALLSDEYTALRRELIDMDVASHEARPGDPINMQAVKPGGVFRPGIGGTTTCVVADRWGNVIAATPSANVPAEPRDGGRAGVTFNNRLRSLNTTPGHPNCIEAGKRPSITLTPTLVLKEGKPVIAISVAGGDLQDQTTLNLLLDVIEFGMTPEEAMAAPRFATGHHQDSFDPHPDRAQAFKDAGSLVVDASIPDEVREELTRRTHKITVASGAIAAPVMLTLDPETKLAHAAGDPKAHRHVAGVRDSK
jgi:gamma-glutamyltranspeptidase / glutathione hydrolase